MKKNRTITIEHNEAGFGVVMRNRHQPVRYHGQASDVDQKPLSRASLNRIRRIVAKFCVVDNVSIVLEYDSMDVTYEYLPDVPFAENGKQIGNGASNPVAILNELRDLAHYRGIVQNKGFKEVMQDPAYVLMLGQLMSISGLGEIDFDVYQKAIKALEPIPVVEEFVSPLPQWTTDQFFGMLTDDDDGDDEEVGEW